MATEQHNSVATETFLFTRRGPAAGGRNRPVPQPHKNSRSTENIGLKSSGFAIFVRGLISAPCPNSSSASPPPPKPCPHSPSGSTKSSTTVTGSVWSAFGPEQAERAKSGHKNPGSLRAGPRPRFCQEPSYHERTRNLRTPNCAILWIEPDHRSITKKTPHESGRSAFQGREWSRACPVACGFPITRTISGPPVLRKRQASRPASAQKTMFSHVV